MNYNQKIGQFGEGLAKDYLEKKGYKIISQNVKISFQEIDIIAKKDKLLVFVEVKTRTSKTYGEADEAVGNVKITNLMKGIQQYLHVNNLEQEPVRLDMIAIDIDKIKKIAKIKHYLDIF